jgi:hypothetical protein
MPARDAEPSTALFRNQAELELTLRPLIADGQNEATSVEKHSWHMTVSVDGARIPRDSCSAYGFQPNG